MGHAALVSQRRFIKDCCVSGGPSCGSVVQMMQEAAWKKSSKALKIAYLDKDGRFVKFVDEKRFHSSYLEWVQKQHNMFDDECVPQDQGVYADHLVILQDVVISNVAQTRHLYGVWRWAWAHSHRCLKHCQKATPE